MGHYHNKDNVPAAIEAAIGEAPEEMTRRHIPDSKTAAIPDAANSAISKVPHTGEQTRLRVCLVTTEFHGLFKNGGIGTANTGLAYALSLAGFDVTVAFADADEDGPRVKEGNFLALQETYLQSGIALDFVPASPLISKAFSDPRSASYCVYLYLKQRTFDVVYFNDCGGQGFYALLAKKAGVFRDPPRMYVVAHGPQEWVLELNSLRYWDRVPVITAYLERRCAALADALVSPSQYLVDWMVSRKWALPASVLVMQNIVRVADSATRSNVASSVGSSLRASAATIKEIVFFGRLEVRKGIELFCDAIDLLDVSTDLSAVRITFLGKFSHVAGLHSGMYVVERARHWRSSLRILSTYGQEEALAYLTHPGRLAVVPSLAENSPCVVSECLQLGLPFLATDSGGTRELVLTDDRDLCLFAPNADALSARLGMVLQYGQRPARLAISQADCLAQWLRLTAAGAPTLHDEAVSGPKALRSKDRRYSTEAQPLVSVCLTASTLTVAAETFVESLLHQTYPNIEFLVLDDGSGGEHRVAALNAIESAGQQKGFRTVQVKETDRAAQRNFVAAIASGDYLLFVEEENAVLLPGCIETLVRAALRLRVDTLTSLPLLFRGRDLDAPGGKLSHFPIGACAELGALENCFGFGLIFVARQSFAAHGGFATPCDDEIVDWLFLASAVLAGASVEVVPEPLFGYKMRPSLGVDSARAVDNHRRILSAYRNQSVEMFEHTIESVAHWSRASGEKLPGMLEGVTAEAREIALHISSSVESNSEEGLRGFVQFCIERRKIDEALDFALHNGRSLLLDAIASGNAVAEANALDTVRRNPLEFWHEISLSADVRERIKSVSATPAREFARLRDGLAGHAIQTGVTILKAAAVCPAGALSVRAFATVEVSAQTPVLLALVVAVPNARLRLSEQGLESNSAFWWSHWIPASGGKRIELAVPVLEPMAGLLDLHFLTKVADDGATPEGRVSWESAAATIAVNGAITASAIEPSELTAPVPRATIDKGVLLTKHPEFPFPVFVPGEKTLLHPLPGRIVLARLRGAVPAGAKGVRSVVSVELEKAHPVQFAVWLRSSSKPVLSETEFTGADSFSGWFTVRDTLRSHGFTAHLPVPASEEMDIYLATRVVEFPDVHYCHAVWHQFLVLI